MASPFKKGFGPAVDLLTMPYIYLAFYLPDLSKSQESKFRKGLAEVFVGQNPHIRRCPFPSLVRESLTAETASVQCCGVNNGHSACNPAFSAIGLQSLRRTGKFETRPFDFPREQVHIQR